MLRVNAEHKDLCVRRGSTDLPEKSKSLVTGKVHTEDDQIPIPILRQQESLGRSRSLAEGDTPEFLAEYLTEPATHYGMIVNDENRPHTLSSSRRVLKKALMTQGWKRGR